MPRRPHAAAAPVRTRALPTIVGGAASAIAVALAVGLSGCTPSSPAAGGSPTPTAPAAEPSASVSASPTAAALVFRMPQDCDELLPASRRDAFAADGLQLLGGPGGVYGTDYFADPTPEEAAGGLSCVWGVDADPRSVIAISVAPLDDAERPSVISGLTAQGLVAADDQGTELYARTGDDVSSAAKVNVLRDDSWISVLPAAGGDAVFEAARATAQEVATEVYVAG